MSITQQDSFSTMESSFECPICLNILIRPVTLVCGHNFCEECLKNESFGVLKQQCPVCRKHILINLRIFKVNLLLDMFIREYYKDNKTYQERRSNYYNILRQRKSNRLNKWIDKFGKRCIVISTYFRKGIPFISLGFAIVLLYLIKYRLGKLDIRKLEASYTEQLNRILHFIKNSQTSSQQSSGSSDKTGEGIVDFKNLIFSKLIKYLFTNYIRLSLPLNNSATTPPTDSQ